MVIDKLHEYNNTLIVLQNNLIYNEKIRSRFFFLYQFIPLYFLGHIAQFFLKEDYTNYFNLIHQMLCNFKLIR
jgi:hypothetical protein